MNLRLTLWLCALVTTSSIAQTDKYPSRPVTLIVPYAAGSSTDVMARGLASRLQELLGQPFVVANREGGSGVVGMTALAQAAPDGLTLAYTPLTPITVQPHLVSGTRLGPDAVHPVCGITENILTIAVKADSPIRSMEDLVRRAKEGPALSYGSGGPNSAPSLGVEDLARNQGLHFTHVAFRGDAPTLQELMAGRLDFGAVVAASASSFIKAGRVRLLAVMSNSRHPAFPSVPTLPELKYPVTQLSYTAIFAPKGTPHQVLDVLEQACSKSVVSDLVRTVADTSNQVMNYQSRADMAKSVREQYELQGKSLRAANAKGNAK